MKVFRFTQLPPAIGSLQAGESPELNFKDIRKHVGLLGERPSQKKMQAEYLILYVGAKHNKSLWEDTCYRFHPEVRAVGIVRQPRDISL